jgi:signal peptidase I
MGSDGRASALLGPPSAEPSFWDSAFSDGSYPDSPVTAVAFSASASRSRTVSRNARQEARSDPAQPQLTSGRKRRPLLLRMIGRVVRSLLWVVIVTVAAVVVALSAGPAVLPFKVLPVWGPSMEPTIHLGSAVILEQIPAERIRVGDIITFHRTDRLQELITHRVVKIESQPDGQKVFVTKGDANTAPDLWRVPAVGMGLRERFTVPNLGYVYGWLHDSRGRMALFGVVVLGLGWMVIGWVWRRPESAKGSPEPARVAGF